MATYRTAPNLGKPPAPETLSKRARRASADGVAAMRKAAEGRTWGTTSQRTLAARKATATAELHGGPHPLPVERIDVASLTGSARSLALHAGGLGLVVLAATTGREVEVRIGRDGVAHGRVVFREGRLVHAFALVGGQSVKVTLTRLKAELGDSIAP